MPSFAIKSAEMLADYLNPVTLAMATELVYQASKNDNGTADMAVYYFAHNSTPDKPKRLSMRVTFRKYTEIETGYLGYVLTDDYRPRKDGIASLVFQSTYQAKF